MSKKKELTQREVAKMGGNALKKKMPPGYYREISALGLEVRLANKLKRDKVMQKQIRDNDLRTKKESK